MDLSAFSSLWPLNLFGAKCSRALWKSSKVRTLAVFCLKHTGVGEIQQRKITSVESYHRVRIVQESWRPTNASSVSLMDITPAFWRFSGLPLLFGTLLKEQWQNHPPLKQVIQNKNWRHSLYFGKDNVNVGAGDVLAIDDPTVFAQFGPVLPVQLFPSSFGVTVNRKSLKR